MSSKSAIAVSVRGLSKMYSIAHQSEKHTTAAEALMSRLKNPTQKAEREDFWALRDVSFDIKKGDVVGIIGRNGAGKSTLLKVLSRITEPTSGEAILRGRVGSLLEVGTGFHPELTGRENIFLNGAILGMTRAEITRQFDAIVDFSGTEKFLDTPVKRYSSGMYVRLAFAVAAHLNPEILIVDEVLAVGDSEFQEKCMGRMRDVANEGRTVLFVSHNMPAVSMLTDSCIVLKKGGVEFYGQTGNAIALYNGIALEQGVPVYRSPEGVRGSYMHEARVLTSTGTSLHNWGEEINFEFVIVVGEKPEKFNFSMQIMSGNVSICHFWFYDADDPRITKPGTYVVRCCVPKFHLFVGQYTINTHVYERASNTMHETLSGICPFQIDMGGIVRKDFEWRPDDCVYIEDVVWHLDGQDYPMMPDKA